MLEELAIEPIEFEDLPAVAAIHSAAFFDRALTTLGPEAVRRYYECQMTDQPEAFYIKVKQGEHLIGFCFGGVFQSGGALGAFLRRNRSFLIWQVMKRPWLVASNPLFRQRLFLAVKMLLPLSRQDTPSPVEATGAKPPPIFRILAIAIHPDFQGYGAGKRLMLAAEEIAKGCGVSEIGLSVHLENLKAIKFYEGLGWERIYVPPDQVWSGGMVKCLADGD